MNELLFRWQMFLRHLRFMCQKELLTNFKDRRIKIIMILPVLIQGLLFGYAATYNLDEVPYVLVDQSHSEKAQDFLAHIDGSSAFSRLKTLGNVDEIKEAMDSGEAILAVIIPPDFESKLARGEKTPIQVIADGKNSNVAGLALSYISRITASWNQEQVGRNAVIRVQSRTWYNPNQITRWSFMPGLMGMISFVQVIMLAGLSIAQEREQGTFDQLLVTPMSPVEILIGKAIPPMLVGLVQSSLLFLISLFWFRVPFAGSIGTLYFTLVLFILSSTGVGLTISAIAENMQQVLVYVFVLLLPLVLLSGLATPISNMPVFLQYATYIDPMRFAVDAIRRIYLEGAVIGDLWGDYIPMIIVVAITLPFAGWLFRNKTV